MKEHPYWSKSGANKRMATVLVLALAILAVAGGILALFKDTLLPKRWGEVEPGLIYRSGQQHPFPLKRMLQKHNIRVIVDLQGTNNLDCCNRTEVQMARERGIQFYRFPLRGNGTGDWRNYGRALVVLCEAAEDRTPTLVHCAAGSQRTGGVVALYELLIKQKAPEAIIHNLQRFGWDPEKDSILLDYLNAHLRQIADYLAKHAEVKPMKNIPPLKLAAPRPHSFFDIKHSAPARAKARRESLLFACVDFFERPSSGHVSPIRLARES